MEDFLHIIIYCLITTQPNKKIINFHHQCSLPDPTPSASSVKIHFHMSDFYTQTAHPLLHFFVQNKTHCHYSLCHSSFLPYKKWFDNQLLQDKVQIGINIPERKQEYHHKLFCHNPRPSCNCKNYKRLHIRHRIPNHFRTFLHKMYH